METNTQAKNTQLNRGQSCTYHTSYFCDEEDDDFDGKDCTCAPAFDLAKCHCTGFSNRWAKDSLEKRNKHPKQRGLTAYLRANAAGPGIEEQRKVITHYCQDNEYYVKDTYIDYGKPGTGLQAALIAMENSDGLIASDLNRFVEHYNDRLRDLRPFVHHFFCHPAKHLVSVEEGVDTGSAQGQANVIAAMKRLKESY